jgi:hypothetical protein
VLHDRSHFLLGVEPATPGDPDKFDEVNPPLAGLDPPDEALLAPHLLGQLALREAGPRPHIDHGLQDLVVAGAPL